MKPRQEQGAGWDGEALLTVAELAVLLKMSESWVRKGVLERTIPFTKMGRSVRFTREQAAAIVARGAQVPEQREHRPVRRGAPRTRL